MLDTDNLVPVPQQELETLAHVIRTANQDVAYAAANLVEHALAAGDALLKAKEQVKHGNWLSWLRSECGLSADRGERYMRLARGRAVLEANSARVRNLSLTGALQILRPPVSSTSSSHTRAAKPATSEAQPLTWRDTTDTASNSVPEPEKVFGQLMRLGTQICNHFVVARDTTPIVGCVPKDERDAFVAKLDGVEHLVALLKEALGFASDPKFALEAALDEVTLEECLQVITSYSQSWRNALEQRFTGHLSVERLLELLENKIESTAKTRAALKDLRKATLRRPHLELVASAADKIQRAADDGTHVTPALEANLH